VSGTDSSLRPGLCRSRGPRPETRAMPLMPQRPLRSASPSLRKTRSQPAGGVPVAGGTSGSRVGEQGTHWEAPTLPGARDSPVHNRPGAEGGIRVYEGDPAFAPELLGDDESAGLAAEWVETLGDPSQRRISGVSCVRRLSSSGTSRMRSRPLRVKLRPRRGYRDHA
jgi:hypothetical protein